MSETHFDIGQSFRDKRTAKELSLDKAAKDTKISKPYLAAIEANEFSRIPNEIVAKGFLQIYADYLGLDPRLVLSEFRKRTKKHPPVVVAAKQKRTQPALPENYYKYGVTAVLAVLLVFFMSWGVLSLLNSSGPNNKQAAKPLVLKNEGLLLRLEVSGRSWIRAYADGALAFEGVYYEGASKTLEAKNSATVKIGNAGAVKIYSGSELVYGGGSPGQVVSKEFTR